MQVLISYTPLATQANLYPEEQIVDLGELDLGTSSAQIRSLLERKVGEFFHSFRLNWGQEVKGVCAELGFWFGRLLRWGSQARLEV